jgi:hypothetical protein
VEDGDIDVILGLPVDPWRPTAGIGWDLLPDHLEKGLAFDDLVQLAKPHRRGGLSQLA